MLQPNRVAGIKETFMKAKVKRWLEDGTIDLFLGYRQIDGHPLPHCYTRERIEELDDLIVGPARYSLEKIATHISAVKPDIKIGLLVRDCNQRALNVLFIWNQLNPDNIETLNVNCCPSNLKEHGDCSYLEPESTGVYKKLVGVDNNMDPRELEQYDRPQRLSRWMYEFQKCIKCYGCRDICPVCFCKECSLEHKELVGPGAVPPEIPIFHLVRAVHMAGRCIDCGLCEDTCPVDIPLRLLYRKVNEIVVQVFDYETGTSASQSPFNILGDTVTLEPKSLMDN
jgi:ferredoxin